MNRINQALLGSVTCLAVVLVSGCTGQPQKDVEADSGSSSNARIGQSQATSSDKSMATGTDSSQSMSTSSMAMDGVVNQEVGYVENGVYVDKAGKPLCPVLGHEVADIKGAKFTVYKGIKYYFCCDSCPGEFAKHKDAYAYKPPKVNTAKK